MSRFKCHHHFWYLQQAWTSGVACGLSWPHKSGSSPPYCGWHSWHSSAASRRAWAAHTLQHRGEKDLTGRSHENWVVAIHEGDVWNLQSKTLASEMSLTAAASTMFLITNFLMALSLGTQRAQLVQRMGCTWPRPFLARPLFLLFLVYQMQIPETNYSTSSRKHTIYRFLLKKHPGFEQNSPKGWEYFKEDTTKTWVYTVYYCRHLDAVFGENCQQSYRNFW